ncbi:MAG: hypothetical protein GXP27_07110 [Planctomycetes bacterium]|nr:hypothetical protein [Planctomycetota bacterium]
MKEALADLAARIRQDLDKLSRVVARVEEGCRRADRSHDDYYFEAVALNLHGFYTGLERLFERIAATVENSVPAAQILIFPSAE